MVNHSIRYTYVLNKPLRFADPSGIVAFPGLLVLFYINR
jgi:hypothetical protein